jgi:predicted Fe-S protein YdhL (DUF1289 family)
MAEIGGWSTLSPERRRAVIAELDGRMLRIADRETRARNYRLPGS